MLLGVSRAESQPQTPVTPLLLEHYWRSTGLESGLHAAVAEFLFQGRKAVHCFSVPVTKLFPSPLLLRSVPLAFQKLIDLSILCFSL